MFRLNIEVTATKLPDLKQSQIQEAKEKAAKIIESEIMAAIKADDPGTEKEIEENERLLSLFPHLVYVDEIPNGYCSDWCCRHLPWFIVTTTVGRFKIGWRKRVINLDWSETECTTDGGNLFLDEDTTKGKRYIYAWSLDDARRYIEAIIDNVRTVRRNT